MTTPLLSPRMKPKFNTSRKDITDILDKMKPSDAIALIESIGKEYRQKNSIRISKKKFKEVVDHDRPDLQEMK